MKVFGEYSKIKKQLTAIQTTSRLLLYKSNSLLMAKDKNMETFWVVFVVNRFKRFTTPCKKQCFLLGCDYCKLFTVCDTQKGDAFCCSEGHFYVSKLMSFAIKKLYSKTDLVGRQVIGVVNFQPKQNANFISECLVTGFVGDNGELVLASVARSVPNGAKLE